MIRTISYLTLSVFTAFTLQALAQDNPATDEEALHPLDQVVPVAEPDPDDEPTDDAAEPTEQDLDEDMLYEEFARYRRLISEGTLDEADVAAKRVVEWAIRIYGARSSETASALNNLAIVQHRSGQYDSAIQNFSGSIEIIEATEDRLTSTLVNPLKGLGASQLAAGRPDRAIRTFHRAAHITQVNEGPHNVDQIEILESVAETLIRMGDLKSARKILDRIHQLNVRFYEQEPLGLNPIVDGIALAGNPRAGYIEEERSSYRRAIRIIESAGDKSDPMLIEPLRRLGESYYYLPAQFAHTQPVGLIATGEIYFKRAVRIAEKSDGVDYRELVKAQLALADYFVYVESMNRAKKLYSEVWELLSTDEERLALRSQLFDSPTPIRTTPLPIYVGGADGSNSPADVRTGRIVVEYSVSDRGRVRDLRTEAFPAEFTDLQRVTHREIRSRIHRPRAVDGVPVITEGMVFEHEFTYRQSDLESIRRNNAAGNEPGDGSEEEEKTTEEDGESRE